MGLKLMCSLAYSPLLRAATLLLDIRLGWKCLEMLSTLAYNTAVFAVKG